MFSIKNPGIYYRVSKKLRTSRNAWVVLLIALFCALIAIAVLLSLLIRSPNEAAIHNSQRLPTVTAKVEKRTLNKPIETLEGQISTGANQDIKVPGGENTSVVTHTAVNPGDTVRSGSLLGRVSGRPVIVLQLPFALYRDIHAGDSGDDVRALQKALAALGLYRGTADGNYNAFTAQAVEALYRRVGAVAPPKVPVSSDSDQSTRNTPVAKLMAPHEGEGKPHSATPSATGEKPATPNTAEQNSATPPATTAPKPPPPPPSFTPVLKTELIALTAASATVEKVSGVGTVLSTEQPLVRLKIGAPTVSFRAAVSQVPKLPVGTRLEVKGLSDDTRHGVATVASIGEFNMSSDLGSTAGRDIVATLEGNTTTLSDGIKVALKTIGEAETVSGPCVPITALRQEAGKTYVILAKDRETFPVKVAETIDGYALLSGKTPPLGAEVIVSVSS